MQRMGLTQEVAVAKLRPAGAIYFSMDEADVQRILKFEDTMVGSDGLPHDVKPHPRLWGTFPRVLGHYSRDIGLFPLETAVYKMTGLTAEKFGLAGRGRLAPDCFADITIFDADSIADEVHVRSPRRPAPARGIDTVIVGGTPVWRGGKATRRAAMAAGAARRPQRLSLLRVALGWPRGAGGCLMLQDFVQEVPRALRARLAVAEELLLGAVLDDLAGIHERTTRCATLRAKPISWVTTIMVMPFSCASCTITSSTSPTISGSSAECWARRTAWRSGSSTGHGRSPRAAAARRRAARGTCLFARSGRRGPGT